MIPANIENITIISMETMNGIVSSIKTNYLCQIQVTGWVK